MSYNFRTAARHPTEALSDDQLRRLVPSVFAEGAHESRSDKFAFVPSFHFVNALRSEGFFPVAAVQGNSRIVGKRDFTKHLLRFRRPEHIGDPRDFFKIAVPEIAFLNSHDGTSCVKWLKGWAREICTNRSVVVEETDALKVSHRGDAMGLVIDGAYTVLGESVRAVDDLREMQEIRLHRDERLMLATEAHMIRWQPDGDAFPVDNGISPELLLTPRRVEDRGDDLATTLNVLQEHAIRGGDHGLTRDASNRRRRVTSRQIRAIDDDIRINAALNRLAAGYARIRQGLPLAA